MKSVTTLAAAAFLCAAVPAFSAPITLDFEDQAAFGSLSYSGDPIGANGALLALANDGTGGGSNGEFFSNNPSGALVMFATDPLAGERAELTTSTPGFIQSVSFSYASAAAGTVYARDGLGNILGQFDFAANSTNPSSPFDTWTTGLLTFSGLAHSIDFTGAANVAFFDNVTVNPVPLPAAIVLFPFGLAALGLTARKRKIA